MIHSGNVEKCSLNERRLFVAFKNEEVDMAPVNGFECGNPCTVYNTLLMAVSKMCHGAK